MTLCQNAGHEVKLIDLTRMRFLEEIISWIPDVVAYSTMSADIDIFKSNDLDLVNFMEESGQTIFRIMGGPHPTYAPEVIEIMNLDAICQGDGDQAILTLLERLERKESLAGIPNIALDGGGAKTKKLFNDLDHLPKIKRNKIYEIAPYYRECGLRSFVVGRGCPFSCSYCFNSGFKRMFKGCGPLLRRRSVDNLLAEIEDTIKNYPPVRYIRFADDAFVYKLDDWLIEFAEKYPIKIGIPFYCLIRPDSLTQKVASLLKKAGCTAISMSVETGQEMVRYEIINRKVSDATLIAAFKTAHDHGIATYGNTIFGIPGTTLEDDFQSLSFTKKLKLTAPTFTICCPYPGTKLWDQAVELGYMTGNEDTTFNYMNLSILNCYSDAEKRTQLRMANLGTLYCTMPEFVSPLILELIKRDTNLVLCHIIGRLYMQYRVATRIFWRIFPRGPRVLYGIIRDSIQFWNPVK